MNEAGRDADRLASSPLPRARSGRPSGALLCLLLAAGIAQAGCGSDGETATTGSGASAGAGAEAAAGGAAAGGGGAGGGAAAGGGGSSSTGGRGGDGGGGGSAGSGGAAGGGGDGGGGSATGCVGPSGIQVGPVKVSEESRAYYPVAIKASDTALAVAWNHYYQQSTSEIRMRLIDRQTLQPLPGDPEILAAGALYSHGSIRLVPSPAGFALSYLRAYYTTGETSCAARMFDGTGASVGYTFDATVGDVGCSHPSMVHDGAGWGYFHLGGGIRLRFVEDDGGLLSYQYVDSVAGGNGATSAFNPITQRYIAVYTQGFAGGDEEIVTAEINLAGTVLASGVRVSNAPGYSRFPEVASGGNGFAAIWDDNRSGSAETYFSALDGSGAPVGNEVAVVTDGYGTRIASSGQAYGLVWRTNTGELHFKAIDLAGNDLGTEHTLAIDLPSHTVGPSVTWDGERFVVVWFQNTQGLATEEIFAAAVCP